MTLKNICMIPRRTCMIIMYDKHVRQTCTKVLIKSTNVYEKHVRKLCDNMCDMSCMTNVYVSHWLHVSHVSNPASATGHGVKNKGNPPSCNNKGKRYDLPFWYCRQKYQTLDLSFSATIATLMTNRTTAPTYFRTGKPFPIELRAIEGSIYLFPVVL